MKKGNYGEATVYTTMLNEQSSVGDLVQCTWCEKVMIVNIGEDVCPACNTEGTLSWIEGCPKEVEV